MRSRSPVARSMSATHACSSARLACFRTTAVSAVTWSSASRVERQVAVVAQDDGVGLVRVLVAHGARELERHAHAFLVVLHLQQAVVDLPDVGEREVGRDREGRDEQRERDEEPLRGAEGSPHLGDGFSNARASTRKRGFRPIFIAVRRRVTRAVTPSSAAAGTGEAERPADPPSARAGVRTPRA